MECFDDLTLVALVDGGALTRRPEIESHLDSCTSCRSIFVDLVRSTHDATPGHPTQLGRFDLFELLGAGAMGEVYVAYDPQLDRRVALKLLKPSHDREVLVSRLLREARMMAQLSHPNVVTVHEAGSIDGVPYVVMEQIEGDDLGAWCATSRGSVVEVLRVVGDVARGLAAVHAVGVVHRDVKPANILVGSDGRARLGDFGLAGFSATGTVARDHEVSDLRLTQTGEMLGTPAYMAPERLGGEKATPASDQFGLCVVLYEALFDQRPFAGATWDELSRAVRAGELRDPPTDRGVPARIIRALRRGLSVDPAARFPSVTDLARELDWRPRSRARIAGVAVVGLALGALIVAVVIARAPAADPCGEASEPTAMWNPVKQAALRHAFAADSRSFASSSALRVSATLDRYAASWLDAQHTTCVANRVDHVESDSLFDRRVACLDQRRHAFEALTTILTATPSRGEVERASAAALALLPVTDCTDNTLRSDTMPLPSDPSLRRQLAALDDRAARVTAQLDLGNYQTGLGDARALAANRTVLDYAPLATRVLGIAAMLQLKTGDPHASEASFRGALAQAALAHEDAELVRLWSALIYVIGAAERRPADALALVVGARIALVRAGSPRALEAKLDSNVGAIQRQAGDLPAAHASLERALALAEREYGKDAPESITIMTNYANVLHSEAAHAAAVTVHERILAIDLRVHGADHPRTAQDRLNVAAGLESLGNHARAVTEIRAALSTMEPALGKDHSDVLLAWNNLGVALGNAGKNADAAAAFEQVLAVGERAPLMQADALNGLAKLSLVARDFERAIAQLERSLALRIRIDGKRHPEVGITLVNLASALRQAGRCGEATPRFDQALELLAPLGPSHPYVAAATTGRQDCAAGKTGLPR